MTTAPLLERAELTVRLLDRSVGVSSDAPGLVSWLREFLLPSFEEVAGDAEVELVVHAARGVDAAPAGEKLLPCYALGERVEPLRGTRSGASAVVDDDYYGVRITVEPGRVEVRPHRPPYRLRPAAFRVCRELVVAPRSPEELHAAAFTVDGRVLVLAGPKNAGKTTLLAAIATAVDGGIVANDRVLLAREGAGFGVRGIPTFVRVREGTMALLPDAFGGVVNRAHRLDWTLAELRSLPPALGDPTRLHGFSPGQLADILGAGLHKGGPLATIALVSVDPSVERFAVDRLAPAELDDRFAACFRNAAAERPPTVFERCLGYEVVPPCPPGLREEVAELVPCVGLRVGPGLLGDERATRELVERLLAL